MKTYTLVGYVPWGTDNGSYCIDISYRGVNKASFCGPDCYERALRWVARNGGRASIVMGGK